jgi:glycosyltransferase involved in cell wall biosynthesis
MAPRIGLYQAYPHGMGGTQQVQRNLARELPAHGYHPVIICPEEGVFTQACRADGLEVLISEPGSEWRVYGRGNRALSYLASPMRLLQMPLYWRRLSHELRQHQIALLHCNGLRDVCMTAPGAHLARVPVLWHVHGITNMPWLEVLAARLVQRVVLVSHGMAEYWQLPRYAIPRHSVIHNGMPGSEPPIASPREGSADQPVIVAVGTLHPRKGYETLLAAMQHIRHVLPQARCQIIGGEWGDGTYAQHLRTLSQQARLEEHVQFLGPRSDVPALLAASRVMAIPSRQETFGMVALEGMHAGKPVVAHHTGGLPEIVQHGETGFLVPPERPDLLAAALICVLQNPALARQFGNRGQQRAHCFTATQMARQFAATYAEVLRAY